MSPKKRKRVLKDSTPSVFVGARECSRAAFRLDTRPSAFARGSAKLFHYISAGGMRQLRRTSADDLAEYRRRVFLTAVGIGALIWLFFYLLPWA